ncbi:Cysteine desulfurase [Pirellulimonas nuda]|uniref:Cysteine desulfurase n=1 Tax=Pirellulimonas nuda TaxID=2528009 RepID=A0A518DJY9_9BACT|nr:cysteine desulfurase family protein [Pirellulimonas nuda]QDU91787.1 Cysteine desulfurase [Pirellulimonas nuda]
MAPLIYLDHNATTPLLPAAGRAMADAAAQFAANPASQHEAGRRARRRLEQARERIARALGASIDGPRADRLLLTSGGTESNNHAILGPLRRCATPGRVLASRIEHPSVLEPLAYLAQQGWTIDWLEADQQGRVDIRGAEALLRPDTRLAVLMLGNNETGVLQPVAELAALCARRGVPLHCDAVQAVGKSPVDFAALGVASLAFTAHKLHGPVGVGGLLVRSGYELGDWLLGGYQPGGRPGTQSVPLAVGMETALLEWDADRSASASRLTGLRDRLARLVLAECSGVVVIGADAPRLPHTLCLAFAGIDRQALCMALDLAGVACSTGSACASGSGEPSHVLRAMGLPEAQIRGAIRLSVGALTQEAEIDQATSRISLCARNLGQASQA